MRSDYVSLFVVIGLIRGWGQESYKNHENIYSNSTLLD